MLGGTGFVGRSLWSGWSRTAAAPAPHHRADTPAGNAKPVQSLPTVDPVECDVHDDAQLARALAGHDAVVNLVAILHGREADFQRVHVDWRGVWRRPA